MKQKLKNTLLTSLLFLASLSKLAFATTDFDISVCNSGCDYVSYNTVRTSVMGKTLTDAVVLSHSGISGSMPDGSSVTGGTSGATGTAVHVSSSQICIYGITGTFQIGEEIYETDGVNYVTSSSAPDGANIIITFYDDQEIVGQPSWDMEHTMTIRLFCKVMILNGTGRARGQLHLLARHTAILL